MCQGYLHHGKPVNSALLARAYNRVRPVTSEPLTQDTDISKLRWFLVDCDPVRPSGISASDEEHQLALDRVRQIRAVLIPEGWPVPIVADSGNGGHLLFPIDLEPEAANVLKTCLEALAFKFDDERVTVDRKVYNPARIWKLYGTTARKGDDVPERPHRLSRILSVPEMLR